MGEAIEYTSEECFNITSEGKISNKAECPTDTLVVPRTINGVTVTSVANLGIADYFFTNGEMLERIILPDTIKNLDNMPFGNNKDISIFTSNNNSI